VRRRFSDSPNPQGENGTQSCYKNSFKFSYVQENDLALGNRTCEFYPNDPGVAPKEKRETRAWMPISEKTRKRQKQSPRKFS